MRINALSVLPRWTTRNQLRLVLGFLTAAWMVGGLDNGEIDVSIYAHYAAAMAHGHLAQSLPHEYPAAAGALILIPWLTPLPYPLAFSLLILGLLVVLLYRTRMRDQWQRRLMLYMGLGCLAILFQRYDIVPMAAIALAVLAAREERWGSAWAWAVLGGLFKLVPFALIPVFFLRERKGTGHWPLSRLLYAGVVISGVALIQQLVAAGSLLAPFHFERARGLEFSSVAGTLLLLTSPGHLTWVFRHSNLEVFAPGQTPLWMLLAVGTAVGVVILLLAAWRLDLPVEVSSLAILTLVICGGKSFAPQYILWLVPLWALWPVRTSWALAAVLTALVYPFSFLVANALHLQPPLYLATVLAALRNATLVAGTAGWFVQMLRDPYPMTSTTTSSPAHTK